MCLPGLWHSQFSPGMLFLAMVSSFLIVVPVVAFTRGTDGDESDHDVVADLGEDLAARILKEREQLKRQNKELRQKLSVAQRFADQRAAMLAYENRAEHSKVSTLQQSLSSVQKSLREAQQEEQNLQNILHKKGIELPLPLQPAAHVAAPRHRPVTSLQQSRSNRPKQRYGQAQSHSQKQSHPKVSKAALTTIRTQLASVTFARKKEDSQLASLTNKSIMLANIYAHETTEVRTEINQSNALLATVRQNAKILRENEARFNKTQINLSRAKQMLAWSKQQIQRFQQIHKQDIATLKDLNITTGKLTQQFNKLNASLTKVHQHAKHDEDASNNKTANMKATLDNKLNALNHTDQALAAKIAKAKNSSATDADKTDELHRQSKRLRNDDLDTRYETHQQKEHIADLVKLVNELEHNVTHAKIVAKAEEARARNETNRMQSGAAKRTKELTKMVSDSKKKLAKRNANDLNNEKKAEVEENATLKDGFNKMQKLKKEINMKLKIVADSEKEVSKDQKAANDSRNQIADLRDTIGQDRQKMATLEAYLGNEKNDLGDTKTQLQAVQNASKRMSKQEAKAEADLQAKIQKQRKALEAAESKVKAKLEEENDVLGKINKEAKGKAATKQKLVEAETATDKKLQTDLKSEYRKGNQTQKEESLKQKKRLEEKRELEAKEAKDKAAIVNADKKVQDTAKASAQEANDAALKQKAKEEAEAHADNDVSELKKEKESLDKEVQKLEDAPKMEVAAATLRAQIASSKAAVTQQKQALEAAQAEQQNNAKALLQQQTRLSTIQTQFQQASAELAASQQSAQATEAGATESWQRLSQGMAERDQLAQQLRTVSAASMPWIQAEAKAQAQVKQLRGKLEKVQTDDAKHKAMLSKLLVFSRSQKSKLKALLSVMTPAQRKHLHV